MSYEPWSWRPKWVQKLAMRLIDLLLGPPRTVERLQTWRYWGRISRWDTNIIASCMAGEVAVGHFRDRPFPEIRSRRTQSALDQGGDLYNHAERALA